MSQIEQALAEAKRIAAAAREASVDAHSKYMDLAKSVPSVHAAYRAWDEASTANHRAYCEVSRLEEALALGRTTSAWIAKPSCHRNDLSWSVRINGETIWWHGYNDAYWWDKVSISEQARRKTAKDGTIYEIDFRSNKVTKVPAEVVK